MPRARTEDQRHDYERDGRGRKTHQRSPPISDRRADTNPDRNRDPKDDAEQGDLGRVEETRQLAESRRCCRPCRCDTRDGESPPRRATARTRRRLVATVLVVAIRAERSCLLHLSHFGATGKAVCRDFSFGARAKTPRRPARGVWPMDAHGVMGAVAGAAGRNSRQAGAGSGLGNRCSIHCSPVTIRVGRDLRTSFDSTATQRGTGPKARSSAPKRFAG
jgi:hypothetical protein